MCAQLIALVGQTVVEQAGLVIANSQHGTLPPGWVEYFDKASGRPYYYNVHSKTTTWYKPRKDKPPPPPPPPGAGPSEGRDSKVRARPLAPRPPGAAQNGASRPWQGPEPMDEEMVEVANSTSKGHGVADVIASMHTRKRMVETVQIECTRVPAKGAQGLQSVSL